MWVRFSAPKGRILSCCDLTRAVRSDLEGIGSKLCAQLRSGDVTMSGVMINERIIERIGFHSTSVMR